MSDTDDKVLTEMEKWQQGLLYNPNYDEEIIKLRLKCQDLCFEFNQIKPSDLKGQEECLRKIIKNCGKNPVITAPFHCDYGFNIKLGDYFYSNYNLVILDCAQITIGDHVFIAPNCCIAAAGHPLDKEQRNSGLEYGYPITIESNVWIGANVSILPNVTIGEGSIIGAGSVVNKDIPPYSIAVGNPCKVVRKITPEDSLKYQKRPPHGRLN